MSGTQHDPQLARVIPRVNRTQVGDHLLAGPIRVLIEPPAHLLAQLSGVNILRAAISAPLIARTALPALLISARPMAGASSSRYQT
jgi:hypothetical protein